MIYLACPYSHANKKVEAVRANEASRAAAAFIRKGEAVFSPVSHGHAIHIAADVGGSFEAWKEVDLKILSVCSRVVVLMLGGWDDSRGVRREIAVAQELGIQVDLIAPDAI